MTKEKWVEAFFVEFLISLEFEFKYGIAKSSQYGFIENEWR